MPHCVAISTSAVPWAGSGAGVGFGVGAWRGSRLPETHFRPTQAWPSLANVFFHAVAPFGWDSWLVGGLGVGVSVGVGVAGRVQQGRKVNGGQRLGLFIIAWHPSAARLQHPHSIPSWARTFAVLSPGKFRCRQRWEGWQIKKNFWHGTEACWRHSHNDVGDCGDDSCPLFLSMSSPDCPPFLSPPLSLPCSGLSVILSVLPNILLIAGALSPESWAQTGALLKFELSDMLFIVESVKMCALNPPQCECLPLGVCVCVGVPLSVCMCVWVRLPLCRARNYNAKLEHRTRGPQRRHQKCTGNKNGFRVSLKSIFKYLNFSRIYYSFF